MEPKGVLETGTDRSRDSRDDNWTAKKCAAVDLIRAV